MNSNIGPIPGVPGSRTMPKFVGICSQCLTRIETNEDSSGTGYGIDNNDNKICYACCAEQDKQYMRDNGRNTLYLTKGDNKYKYVVTNWPGSLILPVIASSNSKTNWGHERTDVWFRFEGYVWWGRNIGDSQIVHCRRTKHTRL